MRVICIDNKYNGLIIGKEYECVETFHNDLYDATTYKIKIDDIDNDWWFFPADNFKTLDEYRNKKLEELGI